MVLSFNFSKLGVATPLQTGDLLLFDAAEPHTISAPGNKKLDVYCVMCIILFEECSCWTDQQLS